MSASRSGAAGEAGGQVGDTVGAAHGADGGGEAVAVTDALSLWFLAHLQSPEQRHRERERDLSILSRCEYQLYLYEAQTLSPSSVIPLYGSLVQF